MPEIDEKTEKPVSFKLDPDLVRQIDAISERDHRSRTGTVKLALKAFIESRKPSAKAGRA